MISKTIGFRGLVYFQTKPNIKIFHEIFEASSSSTRLGLASPGPDRRKGPTECFQCIWVADTLKVVPRNWLIS